MKLQNRHSYVVVIACALLITMLASCAPVPPAAPAPAAPAAPAATAVPAAPAAMDTLSKIKATKYALAGSYNEPPHDWFDPADGKWKGVDNDIVEAILPKLGAEKWDFIVADWSGLIPGLMAKRWDLMSVGMSITDKRKEQISFSEPVYQYGSVIIVPKGNPKGIKSVKDWKGLRVGATLGSTDLDEIKAVEGSVPVPYKQFSDVIADLRAGRIDAGYMDEVATPYSFIQQPEPTLEIIRTFEGKKPRPSGIAFRKEDTALKAAFDVELAKMKADGSLLKILEKYGLSDANMIK